MKISFLTLGCKVNQAESLEWGRTLTQRGHQVVSLDESPDVCVVNTCTVTGKSDYESRRLIRRAHKASAQVMVTGCYAQLNNRLVSEMSGVTCVIDNSEKDSIINKICRNIPESANPGTLSLPEDRGPRTRKFLKVQDGCEYSCTYCLVWKARGRSRSTSPEKVVERVKEALDDGYREIVLTGVHLGLYGRDLDDGLSLTKLISDIISKASVPRIRVSSLEVNEIDSGLLDLMKEGHVCKHLHIPLQSGDNKVLSEMNRNYTRELFEERILRISEYLGGIAIGTDIIAGFPSETEKSFQSTAGLVEELPFTYLHVFPYSVRPGTRAEEIDDIVGDGERKKRAAILRQISADKKASYIEAQIGKTLPVLVEDCMEDGSCHGTADNYLKVSAPLSSDERGSIVPIQVTGVSGDHLLGKRDKSL